MYRFAPDLPPDTPEIWQTCDGFHADQNGVYRTGWILDAGTSIAPGSPIVYGRFVQNASGTEELITVTSGASTGPVASQVFADTTDRTGASTPRPTNAGIVAYGNIVLISTATSGTIASRTIGAAANFVDVASTPGADILLTNPLNIVIGLKTDAGGDGWATSDVGDYTNWTTLEAASGNLRQTSGPITAGVVLGNDVIAFKNRGVYRGSYVGGVIKWQWQLIHAEYGAWGPGCAVAAENKVYFVGNQGVLSFDGAGFQRVDDGIWNTLKAFCASSGGTTYGHPNTQMVYDAPNNLIAFFAQGNVSAVGAGGKLGWSSGAFYSLNIVTGLWGYQSKPVDGSAINVAPLSGRAPQIAWLTGVWEPLTTLAVWDDSGDKWRSYATSINATDVTTYQPKIGTGKIGQRKGHTGITRVIPRWTYSNGQGSNLSTATLKTAKCYAYNSILQVKADVTATDVTLSGNQYWADYNKDAQYHQFDFLINANACIDGVEYEGVGVGKY